MKSRPREYGMGAFHCYRSLPQTIFTYSRFRGGQFEVGKNKMNESLRTLVGCGHNSGLVTSHRKVMYSSDGENFKTLLQCI
jgi:hypothetical protein